MASSLSAPQKFYEDHLTYIASEIEEWLGGADSLDAMCVLVMAPQDEHLRAAAERALLTIDSDMPAIVAVLPLDFSLALLAADFARLDHPVRDDVITQLGA